MMIRGSARRAHHHFVLALWGLGALASCADPRGPDEALDAKVDAPDDSGPDVVEDRAAVAVDAALDAAADATLDGTRDVAMDAPIDVAPDRTDAPSLDAPSLDAPPDVRDAAPDAIVDARADAITDTAVDAGPPLGGCVSGATGTYVARFRWTGSGSRSRATVSYEANTLPDHARWRVTANSRSIGYTPVFDDVFLGVGGLDLSGTVFMDVELSTAGLASLSNVTIAVFGRSFNTTASGSYAWQTFDGTGAAPAGLVANSAPYQWYRADATRAFAPGNSSVLLRITPGPPSGALIVSRVEICFDAR